MPYDELIDDEELQQQELQPLPPEVEASIQIDPVLQQARENRDNEIGLTNLIQGIANTGAAVASSGRVRPDSAVYDAIRKSAEQKAKETGIDVTSKSKLVSDALKAKLQAELQAKKDIEAEKWRNQNFDQRERAIEASRMNQEQVRKERIAQQDQARADKLAQEAKPSDAQIASITDFDNITNSLNDIESNKDQFDTGPIAGRLHSAANFIGLGDPKKAAFAASVGENLADYLRSKSGSTVSAQERISLMQNVPTINDNDETFKAKVKYLKDKIGSKRSTFLSNLEKQGKNVGSFTEPKALSDQDQQALAWASANPKDPRAIAIRKRLGQ